jgi:hypothetical protein
LAASSFGSNSDACLIGLVAVGFGDECASTFDRMRPHSLGERRIVVIRANVSGELFPDDQCSPMAVVATDAIRDTDAALWPVVVQAALSLLRGELH